MEVLIDGKIININPTKSIGKGNEADIYDIGKGQAVKIFKPPNHPDYSLNKNEQIGAKLRIEEHQKKLRLIPTLPTNVIAPNSLAWDKNNKKIIGYVMRLIRGAEPLISFFDQTFRLGVNDETVLKVIKNLHNTVEEIHLRQVIIGDFNDLNILVVDENVFLIDVDSYQFGQFQSKMFTAKFVDPMLCSEVNGEMMLVKPYIQTSDWYSFTVMLMQSLVFVDPYGGVYRPQNKKKLVRSGLRQLFRITVFDQEVRYPKPARPLNTLPDDLLQYFFEVFVKDKREKFPLSLIEDLHWTKCINCGTKHAKSVCPKCVQAAPERVKEKIVIRGKVKAGQIFKTNGMILFCTLQENKLWWLFHEDDRFFRENNKTIAEGQLENDMRFRIIKNKTVIGKNNQMITFDNDKIIDIMNVDSYAKLVMFDTNDKSRFWVKAGQLLKDGNYGQEYIGDVLQNQTLFWVGTKFGFGFYRAGKISVAFVFNTDSRGINDTVKLPPISGQLIDSTCFFANDFCWFLISTSQAGKNINQCYLISKTGEVLANNQAYDGDGSWLGKIRGKTAYGNYLFAATDEGIVRLEADGKKIKIAKEYPDTEPFVDSSNHIFISPEGMYVIGRQQINLIQIG